MPGPFLKLVLVLLLICLLGISLVRALPYEDLRTKQIQAVLLADDCTAPCFMNIIPGKTTAANSIERLSLNSWVNRIERSGIHDIARSGKIEWEWSGLQPLWISIFSRGKLTVRDGVVELIEIETLLSYGDMWLVFGKPDEGVMGSTLRVVGHPQINYYSFYRDSALWTQSLPNCPPRTQDFWTTRVILGFGERPPLPLEPFDLAHWFLHPPACRG